MTNWRAGTKVQIFINNKIHEKIVRPNKAEGSCPVSPGADPAAAATIPRGASMTEAGQRAATAAERSLCGTPRLKNTNLFYCVVIVYILFIVKKTLKNVFGPLTTGDVWWQAVE
jgi:hypothetical protein